MSLFEDAVVFAVQAHSGMTRKGDRSPYILHPLEAAAIVGTMTDDEEILAAAVLHDTVEDTPATLAEIEARFGPRVAALVAAETEDKRAGHPAAETWQARKAEALAVLEDTDDLAVKMLWLGDKLSNMRSFYRIYLQRGDALWQAFNQKDPKKQSWYYHTVALLLGELRDYPAWQEYDRLVNAVFGEYEEA
jgi:myo-inositol-1(or 4)-monophosphatase